MPCAHLHHKCIYSQEGKEGGLELKECYQKGKTYAAFRE